MEIFGIPVRQLKRGDGMRVLAAIGRAFLWLFMKVEEPRVLRVAQFALYLTEPWHYAPTPMDVNALAAALVPLLHTVSPEDLKAALESLDITIGGD